MSYSFILVGWTQTGWTFGEGGILGFFFSPQYGNCFGSWSAYHNNKECFSLFSLWFSSFLFFPSCDCLPQDTYTHREPVSWVGNKSYRCEVKVEVENAFQWKQNHLTLWYEVQELFSQKETDLKVYPRGVLFKNTLQLSSQSSVRPGLSGFSRCDNKEVKRLPQTSPVLEWFHRWEGGGEQSTEELEAGTTFFSNNHIAVLKPLVGFFILTKPIIKST